MAHYDNEREFCVQVKQKFKNAKVGLVGLFLLNGLNFSGLLDFIICGEPEEAFEKICAGSIDAKRNKSKQIDQISDTAQTGASSQLQIMVIFRACRENHFNNSS